MADEHSTENGCSCTAKLFWLNYPILGICVLSMLYLWNDRIDAVLANPLPILNAPAPFQDISSPVTVTEIVRGDPKSITTPNEAIIAKGKTIFANACAVCHGPDGKADTPTALSIKSRNFHQKEGWKKGNSFAQMFDTVTKGLPGTAMPPQEATLNPNDRIAVIHYIRTLADHFPPITEEEATLLDNEYKLSEGVELTVNRIPIQAASRLLEKAAPQKPELQFILANLKDYSGRNQLCSNPSRAVSLLQASDVWQKDPQSLLKFISLNLGNNGFKNSTVLMNPQQLEKLHRMLLEAVNKN